MRRSLSSERLDPDQGKSGKRLAVDCKARATTSIRRQVERLAVLGREEALEKRAPELRPFGKRSRAAGAAEWPSLLQHLPTRAM